ncbi:hypothetical protein [Viridibacillus arvi]|uniref:hypothetical protein n=1 Tax=Viridibacillus arvi TaxID=263475 RepID=UPI0034CD76E1
MPSYTYNSEQRKEQIISTAEEAKRVIIATATVRMHNREELMKDVQITEVANIFGINLDNLKIERSVHPNDFFFTYSFT